ncbi:MAG: hypothetical protein LBU65_11925, partial [Planctomycetaceae bacterium]|nr:hypothetical protein [Planctomycetaceae bacterium]
MMTNARFIQSRSTVLLGLILSVVMTCGVTFGDILNDEDSLTPAAFADSDDSVFAATTSDPILLHRGTVLETSTDLSFDTPIGTWEHTRTYQSGLRLQQNVNDKRDVQGQQWLSGTGSRVLTKIGDNIRLTRTASNSRVFMFDNDKYVPPAGLDASLVKRGADATEEFVLTFNDSGSVYIYYGFHSSVAEALRGKLKEKSNLNYQAAKLAGERYTYDDGGVLVSVTTAEPQSYYIKYSYSKTEQNINRLTRIEVFAGDNTALKFAQSEYTYYEFLPLPNEDVGSFGDLIQVKTSILLSDRKNWNTKTIQYRYYRSEKDGGFNHQVKYVLEADAVERILSSNVGLKNSENILTKSDADKLQSGHTIKDYASRSFTYNKETIDTNKEIATVWGNENLVQKYGNSEVNRITPVGRVKTETVNSSCVSCGGVTKTYYYINVSEIPQWRIRGFDNVVVHVIIEDLQDADGVPQKRTIYGLHNRGNELRKIEIENPTAEKLNVVATSIIENSASQPVEVRSPDVHALIDSNELVAKFLNPYNEKTKKSE